MEIKPASISGMKALLHGTNSAAILMENPLVMKADSRSHFQVMAVLLPLVILVLVAVVRTEKEEVALASMTGIHSRTTGFNAAAILVTIQEENHTS